MLGGSVYPACSRLWFPWREIGGAFKNWLNPGLARGGEMSQSSQACQWAPSTAPSFPGLLAPQLPVWLLPQHSCSGLTSKFKAHGLVFEAGPLLLAQEAPFPWSLLLLTPPASHLWLHASSWSPVLASLLLGEPPPIPTILPGNAHPQTRSPVPIGLGRPKLTQLVLY